MAPNARDRVAAGTLCAIDTAPDSLFPSPAKALIFLSHQTQACLEIRYERRELLRATASSQQPRAKIKRNRQGVTDRELHCVRPSIGNVRLEKLTTNWEGLLAQADCAAYEAKQAKEKMFVICEAPYVA